MARDIDLLQLQLGGEVREFIKVKTLRERRYRITGEEPTERTEDRRKPGRPRQPKAAPAQVLVSVGILRSLHSVLTSVQEKPKAAATARSVADVKQWIESRLGPALDPSYTAPLPRQPWEYLVTLPDGTEQRHATLAGAAAAYGAKATSLRTMLARGDDKCSRPLWHLGNQAVVTCRRYRAAEE